MKRKRRAKEVRRTDGRHHVVAQNAERSCHQKRQHHREGIFFLPAQMRGVNQGQRQRQRNVDDEAEESYPGPSPESLAHQETELHPETRIKRDQEEIERLGMKLLSEVEHGGRHPLRADEKNGGAKNVG